MSQDAKQAATHPYYARSPSSAPPAYGIKAYANAAFHSCKDFALHCIYERKSASLLDSAEVESLFKFSYVKLRFAVYLALDTVNLLVPRAAATDSVLVLRLDAIGDFILWLDAAKALAEHYRGLGKRVTLLANGAWAGWARELGLFDNVLPFNPRSFQYDLLYRTRLERTIRQGGFSIAIQPAYSRDFSADVLVRASGAQARIAFLGDNANLKPWERRLSDPWYTRLIDADPAPRMELIRNAEFIRALVDPDYKARVPDLRGFGAVHADPALVAELAAQPVPELGSAAPYYVFFPGASWTGKQWPLTGFTQLAEQIHAEAGWRGVVCGGPGDQQIVASLCSQSAIPLLNWAGRTTLSQLAGILAGARLLVANDTSAVHIAAAVGVPAICLLGGGHYGRFLPYAVEQLDDRPLPTPVTHKMPCYECNWRCIYNVKEGEAVPCVSRIAQADVWKVVRDIIASSRAESQPVPPKEIF